MRIRDIEIIVRISETGSFSKTADLLSISQPAVSLAVKRAEDELKARIFDRSGSSVTVTPAGGQIVKSFAKMLDIYTEVQITSNSATKIKIGISPLLSGRDVTKFLRHALSEEPATFDIEFLDSRDIALRTDFDIKIVIPALRRRSNLYIDFPARWIGTDNGTFIYSKQESAVWERAKYVLIEQGFRVDNVIEVNDCGYAYHMATSGAGFTPCVITNDIAFAGCTLEHYPVLPDFRLDIFSTPELAVRLRNSLLGVDTPAYDGAARPAQATRT
ncbi:LysR family transcriptional regulator [Chthonobacter rhizosphaerae]|uniref:LysR family transcriptional regulator n=1 Tax=Chthonobacter rhizosphaerae TaxID=2735553 RepID=UPI0015EE5726|nr:LysR family transcriptional regulator [Chthonobacter rhizosphaerae]